MHFNECVLGIPGLLAYVCVVSDMRSDVPWSYVR